MASLNECNFIGNLGADPDIRNLPSGSKVANFSIACTDKWIDKNSGEKREATEWIRVSVFQDGLVRVVEQYLKKGSKVYISGKMKTRKWTDQAGVEKYSTEIALEGFGGKLIMLDGMNRDGGGPNSGGQSHQRPQADRPAQGSGYGGAGTGAEDDIPFSPIF